MRISCLRRQHPANGDAIDLSLVDGSDEPAEVLHLGAFRQVAVGLPPGTPHLDVLQGADEFLGQRPFRMPAHVRQSCLETKSGLDRDGQWSSTSGNLS